MAEVRGVATERQKLLWESLRYYVERNGGKIVSKPDSSPVRIECQPDSSLPVHLTSMGYRLTAPELVERITPTTDPATGQQHAVPAMVAAYQFALPFG